MTQIASIPLLVGCPDLSIASARRTALGGQATPEAQRLEEFAVRYGRSYDAYLATEPGWDYFWSSSRRGVVATARQGRYLFSSGGLLAPEDHQHALLAELVEHADAHGQVLTFFNIVEEQLPLLRQFGFQATKWGEEALVDLQECTWSGKSYEWVRRQTNFCSRHGLVVSECTRTSMSDAQWNDTLAEIVEVSELFLAAKPQSGEMRFLQGGFDPEQLGRKRIFIARADGGSGRIEGFLACNPCRNGRTWVMETYRHRPDAVRGTIPFTMHRAMQIMQAEGVRQASLCLLPGLRCDEPLPGDSAMVRWGLAIGTGRFNPAFETAGTYHFKTRFRPRFENRYLCVRPRMTLGAAWAFIRLLGVLRLDPAKLYQLTVARWKKRASRATLRTPQDGAVRE